MRVSKIYILPKGVVLGILVFLSVYAWNPAFVGGIPLYKIIFPAYAIFLILSKKTMRRPMGSNLKRATLCWMIMSIWGIVSFLWINRTGNEWNTISYDIAWAAIGIVFSIFCLNEKYKERILKYFCIFAGIIGLMGMYTAITGYYFNLTYTSYLYRRNFLNLYRPNGIFFNVNDHAVFMFMSLVALYLLTEEHSKKRSWRVVGTLIFGLNILLVDSRGVELAAIIFIMLYYLNTKQIKLAWKLIMGATLCGFIVVNYSLIMQLDIFSSGLNDSGRFAIMGMCLSSLSKTLFMGVGPGNIATVNAMSFSEMTVAPHNFFLEIFCDYGFVGLICILAWFIGIVMCAYRYSKREPGCLIIWVALIAFIPVSIVCSSLIGKSWVACFFGIFVAYLNSIEVKEVSLNRKEPAAR